MRRGLRRILAQLCAQIHPAFWATILVTNLINRQTVILFCGELDLFDPPPRNQKNWKHRNWAKL